MVTQHHARFRIGSTVGLSPDCLRALAAAVDGPAPVAPSDRLGGRARPHITEIPDHGAVFIKHYHRGGMLRNFLRRGHLWNPRSRGQREFETLQRVAQLGVDVPQPIAFINAGRLWQHTWLVLRCEPAAETLAETSRRDAEKALRNLPQLGQQINHLITHRVHHVDLHPGNVLVREDNSLVIVDFDKAHFSRKPPGQLAETYLRRWVRATTKHRLPDALILGLCRAVRSPALWSLAVIAGLLGGEPEPLGPMPSDG